MLRFRLLAASLLIAAFAAISSAKDPPPSGWEKMAEIEKAIAAPRFPDAVFSVANFGARADPGSDSRGAFVTAIEACAKAGGGQVLVPAGEYLLNGPLHLRSGVELHLAQGAVVHFRGTPDDYLVGEPAVQGCVRVRWEGTFCYNYSPLVYAADAKNIAITGAGVLDGQTQNLWAAWGKKQGPDRAVLRDLGQKLAPPTERIFGKGHFLRPALVEFHNCTGVLIEGVTLRSSPLWTIHPVFCRNVIVRNVRVEPGTTNDDGCDPDSCENVLIEGCQFDTRDDNIAIKAGRDNDGWKENGGRPCKGIIVRNCTFRRGYPGGVAIGSEMSGNVEDVYVENNRMERVGYAFYLKSNPERGGWIRDVWARNNKIEQCQVLLKCETDYKKVTTGPAPPVFHDIRLEDITCKTASQMAFDCQGLAARPLHHIWLKNVTVENAGAAARFEHVQDVTLVNVRVNDEAVAGPK
jgi:polygalacturonase